MKLFDRFVRDMLIIAGVCIGLLVPLDARADDLTPADLEAIDRTLATPGPATCAEPRDTLRTLRDAYARQESPIVRNAIAARVPMVLDTLRFCLETATTAAAPDAIEPARRMLAAARTHAGCSVPAAGIEQLIAAWERESSAVVRSALEARLESLASTVRFCLETLEPDGAHAETPAPVATDTLVVEPAPAAEATDAPAPELAPIAPLPPRAPGGRALGSPFLPSR